MRARLSAWAVRRLLLVIAFAASAMVITRAHAQAFAQESPPAAFEVASVKPHDPADPQTMMVAQPNGRFVARNIPLRMLIRTAYNLQEDQIVGGPAWVDGDKFDIIAKPKEGVPLSAIAQELQALLADRFMLAVHHDTRELPVYALVLARADGRLGPQLQRDVCDRDAATRPVDGGRLPWSPCASISNGFGHLSAKAAPVQAILPYVTSAVHRVVIDRTGLTGNYDLDLTWTPDALPPRAPGARADQPLQVNGATIDPNGPSIFTAFEEQLGLKLEATKATVEVLVIDRVERPTAD